MKKLVLMKIKFAMKTDRSGHMMAWRDMGRKKENNKWFAFHHEILVAAEQGGEIVF